VDFLNAEFAKVTQRARREDKTRFSTGRSEDREDWIRNEKSVRIIKSGLEQILKNKSIRSVLLRVLRIFAFKISSPPSVPSA
jgi:hypothetical protein